ncbi:hypothetical protein NP233_g6350 [Leucocoprinus birnbaumii]|uniref:Uncharacterized protein n=1 Tax=Leucocoprinus birnbaumii TaxID=56174 RepID=A0AAD5VWR7_9AGAR|nr:hypothetical protein NP233_g6350 [Leucocoprinus birnbaumii]
MDSKNSTEPAKLSKWELIRYEDVFSQSSCTFNHKRQHDVELDKKMNTAWEVPYSGRTSAGLGLPRP